MKRIQSNKRLISLGAVVALLFSTIFSVSATDFVLNEYEKSILASTPTTASATTLIGHIVNGEAYYIRNAKSGKYATVDNDGDLIQADFSNSLLQKFRVKYEEDTSGAGNHYTLTIIDSTKTYTELGTQNLTTTYISLSRYDYDNRMQMSFDSQTGYYRMSRTVGNYNFSVEATSNNANTAIISNYSSTDYGNWIFEPVIFEEKTYRLKSPYASGYVDYENNNGNWWFQLDVQRPATELDENGDVIIPYDQFFYVEYQSGNTFSMRNYLNSNAINVTLHYEAQYGFYDIRNSSGESLVYSFAGVYDGPREVLFGVSSYTVRGWTFVQYGRQEVESSALISMDNINCWANYNNGSYNQYEASRDWTTGYRCWEDGIFSETEYYTDAVCIQIVGTNKYLNVNSGGVLTISNSAQILTTQRKTENIYRIFDETGTNGVDVQLQIVPNTGIAYNTTGGTCYQECYIGYTPENENENDTNIGKWYNVSNNSLVLSETKTSSFKFIEASTENYNGISDRIFTSIANSDVVTVASHGGIGYLYMQSLYSKYGYSIPNAMTTADILNCNKDFSNCKLLVLLACNSGTNVNDQAESSVGDAFHSKGIETVVCFTEAILEIDTNEWAQYFYSAISWGLTVEQAKNYAFENVENIATNATEGKIDSCCRIIGNENLALM